MNIEVNMQSNEVVLVTNNSVLKKEFGVQLKCFNDMSLKPISWIWQDWLAAGKFHLLAGAPGTGKTTIGLSLAATITAGGLWPDGSKCEPGNILIWSGEDDPEDTLLPRLLAHGTDPKRAFYISDVLECSKPRAFDPSRDILRLSEKVAQIGDVRLIIVDPIVNVVAVDSHKNGEVRRALQPLVELGNKLNAAVLGISHFSKGTGGCEPLDRVTGSIAFGALARVVLATAKVTDPNGNIRRVLAKVKSNHGCDEGGFNYKIEQVELSDHKEFFASKVIWGDPVEGNARELLSEQASPNERSTLGEAIQFLRVLLANGPVSKKEISDQARESGFKDITLRRAKAFLGVEATHEGFGKGSIWKWYLPSKTLKDPKDVHENRVNSFESNEDFLAHLVQIHPPIVEGCSLADILLHADPDDYEVLKDLKVLSCVAQNLKDSGKIKAIT